MSRFLSTAGFAIDPNGQPSLNETRSDWEFE
jgi:hypothetical protein